VSPARRSPWWEDYASSGPIAVENGIKARSKRGNIGEQWWSRRFIGVLESFGMSGRLQRGRNYARKGQVLEFSLTQGKVSARVQGSRPQPYKVTIGVLPLTTPQWREVERRLASQALFRAKLLAGEMPRDIEQIFADCGTPLFPRSAADLDMHCSCPDWEVPCKHLAAVCYVLAEAFDGDPFAMLAWRGRNRDTLLAALRRAGPRPTAGNPATGGPGRTETDALAAAMPGADASVTRAVLADVTGLPLAQAGDFWSPGLSQARLRALAAPPVAATTVPDLLLRMFDPPPLMVRGKDLSTVLSAAYEQLGGYAGSELSSADSHADRPIRPYPWRGYGPSIWRSFADELIQPENASPSIVSARPYGVSHEAGGLHNGGDPAAAPGTDCSRYGCAGAYGYRPAA
jgi:uncharacterized Zn finger protein